MLIFLFIFTVGSNLNQQLKLADFGASKRINEDESNMVDDFENMNHDMIMKGTPYFMAPEVFEEKCGPKADIWSVGGVIIQMLTGHPPWRDMKFSSPISLFHHIKRTKGPPKYTIRSQLAGDDDNSIDTAMSEKCDRLQNLIKLCFHRDPKKRPTTAQLLNHSFITEACVNESIVSAGSTPNKQFRSPTQSDARLFEEHHSTNVKQSQSNVSPVPETKNWPAWATRHNF